MNPNEIRDLIDHHRRIVRDLERELAVAEASQGEAWVPQKFYTAYYIVSGMVIGIGAAWVVLVLNMIGSWIIEKDALKILKVYSTFFAGKDAMETNNAAILMLAVGVHTLTGAVCGAPIHVVASALRPRASLMVRCAAGVALGVVMWLVNFYGVLSWLQPAIADGASTVVEETPVLIAVLNHVAFTVLVLGMQPLGTFTPRINASDDARGAPA